MKGDWEALLATEAGRSGSSSPRHKLAMSQSFSPPTAGDAELSMANSWFRELASPDRRRGELMRDGENRLPTLSNSSPPRTEFMKLLFLFLFGSADTGLIFWLVEA